MTIRLLVSYKGTDFHGFAEQPGGLPTVAGVLRAALEKVIRQPLELTCAGRTDAGVHARGQVVSFDADVADLHLLVRSVNKQIGPCVVIQSAQNVPFDFNARFSAIGRSYRYTILNSQASDPFRTDFMWWIGEELDIDEMNIASRMVVGEHDFSAFCRRADPDKSLIRSVDSARWMQVERDVMRFEIEANAFCHQMVRSIVGHLVDIGRGKRLPDDIARTLKSRDRSNAAPLAPPQGLVLWEVRY